MTPAEAALFVEAHRSIIELMVAAAIGHYRLSLEDAARLTDRVGTVLADYDYLVVLTQLVDRHPVEFFDAIVDALARDLDGEPRLRLPVVEEATTPVPSETPSHRPASRAAPRQEAVELRVLCADVVVGTVRLQRTHGMVATTLLSTDAYDMIAPAAQRLGVRLDQVASRLPAHVHPTRDEIAGFLAAQWSGATLSLTTSLGEPTPAASVVVVDTGRVAGVDLVLWAVIDFRLTGTAIPAIVARPDRPDHDGGSLSVA